MLLVERAATLRRDGRLAARAGRSLYRATSVLSIVPDRTVHAD
jgi:hypothetical protein